MTTRELIDDIMDNYKCQLNPILPGAAPSCIVIFRLFDQTGDYKVKFYTFYEYQLAHLAKYGRISIDGQIVKPFNIVFLPNTIDVTALTLFKMLMCNLPPHKSLHTINKDTHPELYV